MGPGLVDVEPRTLAARAYRHLEERIVTLQLRPGDAVNDVAVADELRISRTPVREALLRLQEDRLVEIRPRRGVFVAPIDLADHADLLSTRRLLDALIARSAAERATAEHRCHLRVCTEEMAKAARGGRAEEFMRLDRRFDTIVYAASRNRSAAAAVAPMHTHCRRFWYAYQRAADLAVASARHSALAEAIVAADADAAAAESERLIDYLGEIPPAEGCASPER